MDIQLPEVALEFMNQDHAHAVEQWHGMVAALATPGNNNETLAEACQVFLEHSQAHFAREEEAMRAGHFPPYVVHKAEHDRVLDWLADVTRKARLEGAGAEVRQAILEDIPAWLKQHVDTMDRMTAFWLTMHA